MADIKAKKVLFKNRDGEYLIPYIGDTAIENRIANCLLEVPQNIKLELADGVLTLKAGSKVIVPNGVGVFDEIVNSSNLTMGDTSKKGQYFVATNLKTSKLIVGKVSDTVSGTTAPTVGYSFFYNTDTNTILRYGSDVITAGETDCSFPIAIVTMDTTGIVSIDQVFNGFGYIGSTVWVDKGVKGLAPNGFNKDGTLNNKVIEYKNIYTRTFTTASISPLWFGIQESAVTDIVTSNYEYNEKENRVQKISTGTFISPAILAGTYNRGENGVISNFQPKQPFRAVDYNDINPSKIDGQWIPTDGLAKIHNSTATAVGTYTYDISELLPNDGYCYEILCHGYMNTNTTTMTFMNVGSSLIYEWLHVGVTRNDYAKYVASSFVLPIGTDRKFTFQITGGAVSTNYITMVAYRRIGTNQ